MFYYKIIRMLDVLYSKVCKTLLIVMYKILMEIIGINCSLDLAFECM